MKDFNIEIQKDIKNITEFYNDILKDTSQQWSDAQRVAIRQVGKRQDRIIKELSCVHVSTKKDYKACKETLDSFGYTFDEINAFEDTDLLEEINLCATREEKDNIYFYWEFFKFYNDYKAFLESGIDESNYTKEENSFYKKRDELEQLSGVKIDAHISKHPTEIIHRFKESCNSLPAEYILYFVNCVVSSLGANKEYSKIKKTHRQKIIDENKEELLPILEKIEEGTLTDEDIKKIEQLKRKFTLK